MKHIGIRVSGMRIDKSGRLIKAPKYASVSQRLKQKSSKRVRVKKGRGIGFL
jgi:hypothetical protein